MRETFMRFMSALARLYISVVIFIGVCVLVNELWHWESSDLLRFFCYLSLAILSSRLKVTFPGISGTMSVLFVFILFGIVDLSLPEAMFMGCVATLIQCFWRNKSRP